MSVFNRPFKLQFIFEVVVKDLLAFSLLSNNGIKNCSLVTKKLQLYNQNINLHYIFSQQHVIKKKKKFMTENAATYQAN